MMEMKEVGRILHYTKNKMFIVEARDKVTPDTILMNSKKMKIGKVVDIIGSINKPFLVAKPLVDNPEKYIGGYVYYIKRRRRR